MLEQTLARVADRELFEPPIIVCAANQADEIGRAAPSCSLIVEPFPRGSAAAIAFAAHAVDRDTVLLVLPSDHHIADPAPLLDAVGKALPVAQEGRLVTFGIRPTRPETGYGYITAGEAIVEGVFQTKGFVEKPAPEAARELLDSGTAYWNSGMFLFTAGSMLDELERHAPAIRSAAGAAIADASVQGNRTTPDGSALQACPSTSIDYAVMEHSDRIAVVPLELNWSDVGSWAAVYDLAEKDDEGNVVEDGSKALGSRGCFIRSDGPKVVAVGVQDLVVVATADAVLIVPRSEAQRVREAAEALRRD